MKKNKEKTEEKQKTNIFKRIKEDPKQAIKDFFKYCLKYADNNRFFLIFILFALLNDFLLRFLTANDNNNAFRIDPLLADFALACFIGSFCYLFKEKKYIYLLIFTWIFSILCTINSTYYTYYTSFASVSSLSTLKFVTAVGDAVVENVFSPKDLIFLLFPLIFMYIHRHYKKNNYLQKTNFGERSTKKFFSSLILSGVVALMFSSTLTSVDIGRFVKQWNREYIVMKYGIYVYHFNDSLKSMEPKLASLFGYDNAMKDFNDFYEGKEKSPNNKYTGIFEGKNLIVIHGESIQNFLIGLKINGQEVTPNLNKLAEKSMYFDNFYTQVSLGTSSDTEFTFNTSLMPAQYGTAFGNYFDKQYVSVPKLLKEKGYYSFAMHGNNGDFWNRRVMHKRLGYDKLYAKESYEIDEVIGLGISDVSFFNQSIEILKKINEEYEHYYGTLITLSNHTPFSDLDKYGEFDLSIRGTKYNEETGKEEEVVYPYLEETKLGYYLKSVHYADMALGVFFDLLEENGLLDNTVLLFYGDHDARLPRNNFVKMYNYDPETDGILPDDDPNYVEFNEYDYELNRKTPLIIYSKDREDKAERISYLMGMYDCMPTLGNMFGFYNKYALGHDIFDIKDNNIVIFPTGNWLTKEMYYSAQKNESYMLSNSVIEEGYIEKNSEYADRVLNVSNEILIYDLIKNSKIESSKVDETKIVGENN